MDMMKSLKEFYEYQGQIAHHQKQMYEVGDLFTRWWQNKRQMIVKSLIQENRVSSILDVGCAEGLYTRFFAKSRRYSVGVDISRPKLVRAKKYSAGWDVSFVLASAENLPFRKDSFDVVICIETIRLVNRLTKAIGELFFVAKRFVIAQSATHPTTIFQDKVLREKESQIEVELSYGADPFNSAFWVVSARALIRLGEEINNGTKIRKVIGQPFFLISLFFFFPVKNNPLRNNRMLVGLAAKIDNLLSQWKFSRLLGGITTVLFEKEEEST